MSVHDRQRIHGGGADTTGFVADGSRPVLVCLVRHFVPCQTPRVRDADPTSGELAFLSELASRFPVDDWYHQDDDGTLWMIVSRDFVTNGSVTATLRLDYDGRTMRGGWSPSGLNWDDGVRASDALIDTSTNDGLQVDCVEPQLDGIVAAAWFARHIEKRHSH